MSASGADSKRAVVSVTLHDVAPATLARCERLIERVQRVAPIALTLLVVPYYHGRPSDAGFDDWLDGRLRGGDELALHGLTHYDDVTATRGWLDHARRRWYTDGEGEFAAIDMADATRRLNAGRRWFARRRWPLQGFVAPAWLLGDGAWRALRAQPFRYTCTRTELLIWPPRGGGHGLLRSRSIVYSTRSAWRRALSLPWNAALARLEAHRAWLRVELHPDDVAHGAVCDAALGVIDRALARGRAPATLSEVAERLRRGALP